jgi:hypothetical protein
MEVCAKTLSEIKRAVRMEKILRFMVKIMGRIYANKRIVKARKGQY